MSKLIPAGIAALLGAAPVCSICLVPGSSQAPVAGPPAAVVADTAISRLAIKGMTCGSCAITARLALQRVPGVYDAHVSYDSASAVVRYDPARTEPVKFIAKLEEMTGYKARVADTTSAKSSS